MRKSAPIFLFLVVFVLSGCDAKIHGASKLTATSAQLNAEGRSDCGMGGTSHFEYAKSLSTLNAGQGQRSATITFGQTANACGENPPMYKFGRTVTGLTPNTTYLYRLCGKNADGKYDGCTKTSQFTTFDAPSPMPYASVVGNKMYAGGKPLRVFGMISARPNAIDGYVANPTSTGLAAVDQLIRNVRTSGGTQLRIESQLFDIITKDASGNITTRSTALTALGQVFKVAEKYHVYVDFAGNRTIYPDRQPAWYDAMTNEGRWLVQALYWREVAKVGAISPAILCYELTSEPSITSDPNAPWYFGNLGGYNFASQIARGIPSTQQAAVVRQWIAALSGQIKLSDKRPRVTIGTLPTKSAGPMGAANIGPVLDLVSPHIYPGMDVSNAMAVLNAWAAVGKPIFLGETSAWGGTQENEKAFLLQAKPYTFGQNSFYMGVSPEDFEVKTMVDAVQNSWAALYIGMRPQLM